MKNSLFGLALLLSVQAFAADQPTFTYTVDLNQRGDDVFKVSLAVTGLRKENNVFQFAATAPGTYQTMNMGRYVRNFKAFDAKGRELPVRQLNVNQWELGEPTKTATLRYGIAETWDTPVKELPIYAMCGSSLENDHALINGQTVFGYVQGLQDAHLKIKVEHPKDWQVGTALSRDEAGNYLANDYDHIVDSPILLGQLTKATSDFNGTAVEIYTYSKTGLITSEKLMASMRQMLTAANQFVVNFPVKRYTFLYHFENRDAGAWEHSYSSEYVMKEEAFTPEFGKRITDIAAHEFFHIITPLNIHSELIESFNFVTPTPSEHLWLYEGTTEWAAHAMQLRGGMYSLTEYLAVLQEKLLYNDYYDKNVSLSQLSLTSFTPEGQKQYGNIYQRGALVASLLDLRLLQLSGGKRGLREVVNELSGKYGPSRAFPEKDFFQIFTQMTYSEIGDFFGRYVRGTEPLPVKEYFATIGIDYEAENSAGKHVFTENPNATPEQLALRERWLKN